MFLFFFSVLFLILKFVSCQASKLNLLIFFIPPPLLNSNTSRTSEIDQLTFIDGASLSSQPAFQQSVQEKLIPHIGHKEIFSSQKHTQNLSQLASGNFLQNLVTQAENIDTDDKKSGDGNISDGLFNDSNSDIKSKNSQDSEGEDDDNDNDDSDDSEEEYLRELARRREKAKSKEAEKSDISKNNSDDFAEVSEDDLPGDQNQDDDEDKKKRNEEKCRILYEYN